MTYTAPNAARATGYLATAANWNELANDIIDLDARTNPSWLQITTSQTTTSTSYTDLATTGPAVTLLTGTLVRVDIMCALLNSSTPTGVSYVSVAVSGATTTSPGDALSLQNDTFAAGNYNQMTVSFIMTVTAGTNTFTLKYRVNAGTGTFLNRGIIVTPANKLA